MTQKEPSGLSCAYRWGINDRHGLHNLLLVRLRTGAVEVADDRGHASLVAHVGRQMDGLLGVVLREPAIKTWSACESSNQDHLKELGGEGSSVFNLRLDLSPVAGGALARQVRQRTMAGSLVLCAIRSVWATSCIFLLFSVALPSQIRRRLLLKADGLKIEDSSSIAGIETDSVMEWQSRNSLLCDMVVVSLSIGRLVGC